jgi:hypothetical protein
METDKVSTWSAGRPVLEAFACQFARCAGCGGLLMTFEARDGSRFAVAHLGDDAATVTRWITNALAAQ